MNLTFINTDADIDAILDLAVTRCESCTTVIEPEFCLCEPCAKKEEREDEEFIYDGYDPEY